MAAVSRSYTATEFKQSVYGAPFDAAPDALVDAALYSASLLTGYSGFATQASADELTFINAAEILMDSPGAHNMRIAESDGLRRIWATQKRRLRAQATVHRRIFIT